MSEETKPEETTPAEETKPEFNPADFISKTDHNAELNRLLAADRRKNEAKTKQATKAHQTLQRQMDELLEGRSIDEIRDEIEETQSKLRTAEDQAKIDAAKHASALESQTTRADTAGTRLRDHLIGRALKDEAIKLSSTPAAADLISRILAEHATADLETGKVVCKMEIEEEGVKIEKDLTPEQAVQLLESNPSQYGPLFKSGVSGGTGNLVDGVQRKEGKLDIGSMTMQQYAEMRKKDPNFLQNNT